MNTNISYQEFIVYEFNHLINRIKNNLEQIKYSIDNVTKCIRNILNKYINIKNKVINKFQSTKKFINHVVLIIHLNHCTYSNSDTITYIDIYQHILIALYDDLHSKTDILIKIYQSIYNLYFNKNYKLIDFHRVFEFKYNLA